MDSFSFIFPFKNHSEETEALRKKGVNIIIALGHSGYDVDMDIAKNCPLVDVVIGGHSNTFLYSGQQPDIEKIDGPYPTVIKQASGKEVPVVQAYAYTKYIGELELSVSFPIKVFDISKSTEQNDIELDFLFYYSSIAMEI